ncbi:MAG: hypothetical protein AAFR75_05440 [Pseudomonadota bacterium]
MANLSAMRSVGKQIDESFGNSPIEASVARIKHGNSDWATQLRMVCPLVKPKPPRLPLGLLGDEVLMAYELTGYVNYVDCAMRNQRQRFCDKHARARLVEEIRAYIAQHKEFLFIRQLARKGIANQGPHVRLAMGADLKATNAMTGSITHEIDLRIAAGLNDLIGAGYFSPWDFGGFLFPAVPRELSNTLRFQTTGERPCQH